MADEALVRRMTADLAHRGPDDAGFFADGPIALGHRRLAIIDLSSAGHQPMPGPDGSLWLVYNGEIYNYLDLRADLQKKGHSFQSNSDTEIILHAFQEYGPDCLTHFNGMFAFALWDSRRQRLFLARDRFGIKPLYYYQDASRLIFASEIKPILVALAGVPRPNSQLIYDFLTTGALDHTDDTFFAGIHKLPPAHYALIQADGHPQIQRYWDFEVNSEVVNLPAPQVAQRSEAFFDLLTDSVRLQLVSDVPVGSCLSGGLDSSTIVSIISRLIQAHQANAVGPRQQTFSACYPHTSVDEQPHIDRMVAWSGALSHKVFPTAPQFLADLPLLIRHQEEPFGSTSIFAQWSVMRQARDQGVIVLLDGQGADEQLLGYRKFYAFYLSALLRQGRPGLAFREAFRHFGSWSVLKTLQVRRGLRYLQHRRLGSTAFAQEVLQPDFIRPFQNHRLDLGMSGGLAARIKADTTRFSLPVLLRYEDKNSMAFSRESRVPFLDHRLVEFVADQPLNLKLQDGWTKYLLRRGAQGKVPAEILTRKDKLGFATPEDNWFRQHLAVETRQLFQQAVFLPEVVDLPALAAHFDAFVAGRRSLLSAEFFFRFFILEHWAQAFLNL